MDAQFQTRHKEHLLAFKNNKNNSAFSQHLIELTCYPSCGRCQDVVYTTHKERHLGTNKKYYIHRDTTRGALINDRSILSKNKIFDVVVYYDS